MLLRTLGCDGIKYCLFPFLSQKSKGCKKGISQIINCVEGHFFCPSQGGQVRGIGPYIILSSHLGFGFASFLF
jgi:hypothetical protein